MPNFSEYCELNNNTALQKRADLVGAQVDDEWVMFDIEQGQYFGLDGIGQLIWENLAQPISFNQLCKNIHKDFDVDFETCQKDIKIFIQNLIAKNLVQPCD